MNYPKIKIAIVDDNRQTIISLKEMINYSEDLDVVFTSQNGVDYLEKMEALDPSLQPQVVLMDIDMPILDGIQTISISKIKYPNTKYLVLTVFDDEDKLFKAIQAGANGYLLKDEKVSVIIDHIKNLINQESTPMSPAIARKTFELLSKVSQPQQKSNDILVDLSGRETEVLYLMMEGHNYKIIGEKLYISPNTVKKHIAHIYEKLHVNSRMEIMKLGIW